MIIKPTKYSLLSVFFIVFIANGLFLMMILSSSSNESSSITVLKGLGSFLFADLFFIVVVLYEYKTFQLKNDVLVITSTYLSLLFKPKVILFNDVIFFEVTKYSFMNRKSPLLKIYYKNGKKKRVDFRGSDLIDEFQKLFDTIRSKGIEVKTEGDYWR